MVDVVKGKVAVCAAVNRAYRPPVGLLEEFGELNNLTIEGKWVAAHNAVPMRLSQLS